MALNGLTFTPSGIHCLQFPALSMGTAGAVVSHVNVLSVSATPGDHPVNAGWKVNAEGHRILDGEGNPIAVAT